MATVTEHEMADVDRANASGRTPVVFVHGSWLLPNSWDLWRAMFEDDGFTTLAPGWPDEAATVEEAHAHPEVVACATVGQMADHYEAALGRLEVRPAVVGHCVGGLVAQILAGRGLASVTVAIDPAPFRGARPLPVSALKASAPALGSPAGRGRAVPLTFEQFRWSFANAVGEEEAKALYDTYAVPAPRAPLFDVATANLNPWTEARVDTRNPARGPLLLLSGEKDRTVPWAVTNSSFRRQRKNPGVTEIVEVPGRGHALTIDSGWREVAERVRAFVRRFVEP